MQDSFVPIGVKIMSWVYYLGAIMLFLFSAWALVGSVGILSGPSSGLGGALGGLVGGSSILVAMLGIGLGLFNVFVGRRLSQGVNWARILTIIFAVLVFLGSVASISGGQVDVVSVVTLLISLSISIYFLFMQEAKQYFSGNPEQKSIQEDQQ